MELIRYYFWQLNTRGWTQLGRGDGYKTIKECKKDNHFYIEEELYAYNILKAIPFEKGFERNIIQ